MKPFFCVQYLRSKKGPSHCLTYFKKWQEYRSLHTDPRKVAPVPGKRRGVGIVPASAEAGRTLALSRDVVAQSAVATLTVLAAVNAILAKRARLGANKTLWNGEATEVHESEVLTCNTHDKNSHALTQLCFSYWCSLSGTNFLFMSYRFLPGAALLLSLLTFLTL